MNNESKAKQTFEARSEGRNEWEKCEYITDIPEGGGIKFKVLNKTEEDRDK